MAAVAAFVVVKLAGIATRQNVVRDYEEERRGVVVLEMGGT